MFWVRLKDGTLERVPGDSYKETKYGLRIYKGERWIADFAREHLIALYRDPPVALRDDLLEQVARELGEGLEAFVERELAEPTRESTKEKLVAWLESVRAQVQESGKESQGD